MWLVKKAASKVKQISQTVIKQETQSEKMINIIISNSDTIMPMKQMSELASKSYQMEYFEDIVRFTTEKLNDIKIEKKSLKKRLNLLVLVTYLIKYGVGGFIDEFRAINDTFERYQVLIETEKSNDEKVNTVLNDLNQRAIYIKTLLNDKNVLARQKEIAWMIRQKMASQIGDYSQHTKNYEYSATEKGPQQTEYKMQKVQTFLEMYVWKYTSKLDKKLDEMTDAIIGKIDDYLDGQIPESFDIDEIEESSDNKKVKQSSPEKAMKRSKDSIDIKQQEAGFVKEKLKIEEENLIDLKDEPTIENPTTVKVEQKRQEEKEQLDQLPIIKLDLNQMKAVSNSSLENKKAETDETKQ